MTVERDVISAKLDRALELLDKMDRMIRRSGGYMTLPDQAVLAESTAFLVDIGKRKSDAPPTWIDRARTVTMPSAQARAVPSQCTCAIIGEACRVHVR
jgi:hypothetical protein